MLNQTILIVSLYILFGAFEFPFYAQPGQRLNGKIRNIIYGSILLLTGLFTVGFVYYLIPFQTKQLPDRGLGFSLMIVFVYIFLQDVIFYWYHRAQHKYDFLWVIHELHHSDTELNVTTSKRTYWLDQPIQTLLILIPLNYFVGLDNGAVILLPIISTFFLFFTHANLRLHLGFLTPVITGPQLHRIHHSNLPQHRDKNLAQFFPIIDIVFGTYYKPRFDEFPTTGTHGLASDAPISHVIKKPLIFLRAKIVRAYLRVVGILFR